MRTLGAFLLFILAVGAYSQSCAGRCGDSSRSETCQCNNACSTSGNCCSDYEEVCLSCDGRCGERYLRAKPCQCNSKCRRYGNCCSDYFPTCRRTGGSRSSGGGRSRGSSRSGSVTTAELRALTERFFQLDVGGAQITIHPQGRSSSSNAQDNAPGPLIGSVPSSVLNKETTRLMSLLLDNYIPLASAKEVRTSQEQREEDNFLNALIRTDVMKELERFLKQKGLLPGTLRAKLKEMWFTPYKRAGRNIGSSGFEHVFIGELKGGKVSGFHNWLNFRKEEEEGDLNYKGYMKTVRLNGKGDIVKLRFEWMDQEKPVGSIFVGTTPELEMALYTLCFITKPGSNCPVQLAGHKFGIQTYTYDARGKSVIGSAFPNI